MSQIIKNAHFSESTSKCGAPGTYASPRMKKDGLTDAEIETIRFRWEQQEPKKDGGH